MKSQRKLKVFLIVTAIAVSSMISIGCNKEIPDKSTESNKTAVQTYSNSTIEQTEDLKTVPANEIVKDGKCGSRVVEFCYKNGESDPQPQKNEYTLPTLDSDNPGAREINSQIDKFYEENIAPSFDNVPDDGKIQVFDVNYPVFCNATYEAFYSEDTVALIITDLCADYATEGFTKYGVFIYDSKNDRSLTADDYMASIGITREEAVDIMNADPELDDSREFYGDPDFQFTSDMISAITNPQRGGYNVYMCSGMVQGCFYINKTASVTE